jgi:3-oxoacyl-[acyl-carrier-protein] synthase-3
MSILFAGTGSYTPANAVSNEAFFNHEFYTADGERISQPTPDIIQKFKAITGIEQRRYAADDQQASDLALIAAQRALADADTDPETLDGIIVAHNFGNIPKGKVQTDILPSLASRVKHDLKIKNPACTAFDVLYGCPGWIQGVMLARQAIMAGTATRYLVIGAETLSRVLDPYDRDSMIYADGAGAVIVTQSTLENKGILSAVTHTYAYDEAYYLNYGESLKKDHTPGIRYIKMEGRKIYEFALSKVPAAMKACLDQSGIGIEAVKKVFIHQANEKMDEGIIRRFYELYGIKNLPELIMPMSIHLLGNSSVATVPTLLDMVRRGELPEHQIKEGDIILLASVGAGMNISAITYQV